VAQRIFFHHQSAQIAEITQKSVLHLQYLLHFVQYFVIIRNIPNDG
jgi:hypothetical protein